MKKISILLILMTLIIKVSAQKSEIKVFPQDKQKYSQDSIINKLVTQGVKILDVKTNFSPESHVMGFFIDPVRYMGIGQGMILSTGIVDNITRENSTENYTSMEIMSGQTPQSYNVSKEADGLDTLNNITYSPGGKDVSMNGTGTILNGQFINMNNFVKEGDADLSKEIKGLQTFDARVVEIKFIPTADTLYYRYVFASEEYEEYVCSPYNDVFAFYLCEKGGEKVNIALVPGQKLPVSINTINNGNPTNKNCEKTNSYLFKKNNGKQNLLYDGFTKVLDVRQKVTPGKEYYIKIAIADASDGVWDSAILLENGSIFSYFESFEIPFDKNSFELNETTEMDEILKSLQKHPKSKAQLVGHCDQPGTTEFNYILSGRRVTTIYDYLVSHGISSERIIEISKGNEMPRYTEDDRNRRVEVFVMGE